MLYLALACKRRGGDIITLYVFRPDSIVYGRPAEDCPELGIRLSWPRKVHGFPLLQTRYIVGLFEEIATYTLPRNTSSEKSKS